LSPVVLTSLVLLFLLVLLEGVGVVALFRQVGLLHIALAGRPQHLGASVPTEAFPSGTKAPYLAGVSIQGEPVALDRLFGQRVLVAFVHPLCEPCNAIGPELEALHREGAMHTKVIVVSDGDRISTEEYAAEHHLTAPILYEPRNDFNQQAPSLDRFRVPRTPFAYLLDEQHRVVTSGTIGKKEFFWRVASGLGDNVPSTNSPVPVESGRA